jgi:hypothetical protein
LTSQAPLLLRPAWKLKGDSLAVVIEYSLNPAYSTLPEQFHNLGIFATYTGARAAGCQTKPSGTHLKEKSLVFWRPGDLNLTNEWHKLVARFVGADGAVPEPGHVEARWELHGSSNLAVGSGISLSRLEAGKGKEKEESDNPFADAIASPTTATQADNWVGVETSKKLTGGKYEARPFKA